jgi:hypothetical protein
MNGLVRTLDVRLRTLTLLAVCALALGAFSSCADGDPDSQRRFRSERDQFRATLHHEIDGMSERLDELESDLGEATEEDREEIEAQIGRIEQGKANLQRELDTMGQQTVATWDAWKAGASRTLREAQRALSN